MLHIARHTDYATQIALHLACLGAGAQASIAEIAEQRNLPSSFIRRLVAKLAESGILATARGPSGGIRLARPAAEISLLDIVLAMEGPIDLDHPRLVCQGPQIQKPQSIQRVWAEASLSLEAGLAAIRFDALAASSLPPRGANL